MSHAHEHPTVPKPALIAAAVLIVGSILLAATARNTGVGTVAMPDSAVVETRTMYFADRADGAVVVSVGTIDNELAVVNPGEGGFVRGVMRGMARDRVAHGVAMAEGYELTRWANGTLTLLDPYTGRKVDLDAFGPDNVGAFADLMRAPLPATAENTQ